jgi:DNA gyrase inhibitor GyrI
MAIEQPSYRVIEQSGEIEIRQYEPYLVAETLVDGKFGDAGNEGFRRLFNYITGNNRAQTGISMTAPVSQSAQGQKIAMTAPVNQTAEAGGYWVSFVVPSQYTMATVPQPLDPRVRVREVPAQTVAVLRYAGFWGQNKYQRKEAALLEYVASRGLSAAGGPQFARYDPPFMPPFLRRNEILLPLDATPVATTGERRDRAQARIGEAGLAY